LKNTTPKQKNINPPNHPKIQNPKNQSTTREKNIKGEG
jgi:hypothetical protein